MRYTQAGLAGSGDFRRDGITINSGVFDAAAIENFVRTFYHHLQVQAYKLRLIDEVDFSRKPSAQDIDALVQAVDAKSKAALDFVVQLLRETPSANALVSSARFVERAASLLDCPVSLLKIHMDGILINVPSNERRLYKYHSEQHYYPQRRSFLNFWMPVIRDKTATSGAMVVKVGAHKAHHTFVEYTGFNKKETNEVVEHDFFHQLQIPDEDLQNFPDLICDLPANTAAFFHQNLPHTSTVNSSSDITYTLIMRIYDYRYDPTLSDNTGVKPYSSAAARGGYPDLRPMRYPSF